MILPSTIFALGLATGRRVLLDYRGSGILDTDLIPLQLGLLLAGDEFHHLQQGPVGLFLPDKIGQDVFVSYPSYQLVADDLLAVVYCSIA